jgi:polyisoprenoid-binding protein YceI
MRRRLLLLATALTLSASAAAAQPVPRTFTIDASHSSVAFKVPFMGFGSVKGEFQEFAGALLIGATPEQSAVTVVIKTPSISTHSKPRDNHLRSPDFFAADSFPLITFQSTRIQRSASGLVATGLFTMRGVARTIALPLVEVHPPMKDAWGNTRITYRANTKLSRKEYNIRGTAFWNSEFDPGRFAVADSAEIELEISATIPNTARWNFPHTDSLVNVVETRGVDAMVAELAPNTEANTVFVTAYKLVQRGKTEQGMRLYEWALERYEDSPLAANAAAVLGDTQMQNGKRAAAVKSFRRVLAADPDNPVALGWLRYLGENVAARTQ